jgi:4-hydroxy-2-oxoheptanedioate aldolase
MTATASTIRQRVLAGETLVGAFLSVASPSAAEIVGRSGLDWVIVDLEHGAGTEADLLAQLHALGGTPAAALVRPPSTERLRVGRVLDLGAEGVMVPRLDHPDEVREAVSYLRFPPAGVRGVALLTRGAGLGEVRHADVAALNDTILGIFQVESPVAVRNAAEIAAIDGVDCLFVGPADLSHGMGIPGRFDEPAYREALDAVVAACRAAGKSPGILLRTVEDFAEYHALGFRFIGVGSDSGWLFDGARRAVAQVRAAGVGAGVAG